MADNLAYTPGSGASVATDEIGGVHYQRIKLATGEEGEASDVSGAAPLPIAAYGELIEAIEVMRMAIQSLNRTIGQVQPDTAARMRVVVDAMTSGLTLSTVGSVSTVNGLTNQTQIGGLSATEQIPSLMRLGADSLRRNISVS